MVKRPLSERGNPLPVHGLLSDSQQVFGYMHHPRHDSTYHSLCYTRNGAQAGFYKQRHVAVFNIVLPVEHYRVHDRQTTWNETLAFLCCFLEYKKEKKKVKIPMGNNYTPPPPPLYGMAADGLLFPISSKGSFICIIPHTG